MSSNYTYQLAHDEGAETYAELIELHVRMVSTGNEYVVNIVGELEPIGPGYYSKPGSPLPEYLILSLLGGGNYSKIKRVRSRRKISSN